MYRLSRRFRRRFGKDKEEKKDKHALDYVIVLLDGSDLSFNLDKKAKGQELLDLVFKNLDLVEKDYFGLQFMDTHQVSHWLDPLKKIKKQVRIGPPFTLHFRVRFYAAEPQDLSEELTRYHFFLQIKQDISKGKLEVPLKIGVDLTAYSLQSHLGDFEPELHEPSTEYITEFKFIPNQTKELEKEIKKKHQALVGLNPAECEVNFLRIVKNMDFYGIDMHNVVGENKVECQLGLTPRGIWFIKEKEKKALFSWPKITKMAFKKSRFLLEFREDQRHTENFTYTCTSSHDAKHLWKSAIEHHTFFRLVKTASRPARTSSFLKFGSRYRFSGRTEHQAQRDARMSGRKSTKIERTKSERFSRRPTVGYIRVGSRVWGKALNGDFYKGVVTGLGEMLHIKFDNGDTIAHDRTDPECVVFDQTPEMNDLEVGTRVIAHWPGLPAKLSGKVIGIEHGKYYVEYDDGDKHHNTIDQLRILKPPMYFGPGSMRNRRGVRKTESMKVTSLTGKAVITTELPKRSNSNGHVRPEMGPRDTQLSSTSSVDGAPHLTSAAEITKKAEDGPSESFGASNASDQKRASISDGLPDKRPKNIHLRSASLPGNVRAPRANESDVTTSPKADKRAKRNKSFGGMTKTSQAKKPPLEIFSLPETDVDSGITVACERSNSGRASKRNLRTMDLMKTTNETDGGKKEKPGKAKSKEERLRVQLPDRKDSGKRSPTATRPDVRVPPNVPYAPNYLETDLDDERRRPRNYFVDAQRSFTVFIPNDRNKLNHRKRFTHFGGFSASDEKLLQDKDSRIIRKRSSLPDLRTFFNQKEEGNTLEGTENKLPRRNRTHSLNDLAKMSPSNSKQTPLHIDNLSSAKDARADSPLFSPTLEQSATSNKLVQVTDL